jgi:peptide/nickel transport system substrate-binding protein
MPPEQIADLPGYGLDVQKNREEALALVRKLGYGPDNRLKVEVTTRDWSLYRDPAVLPPEVPHASARGASAFASRGG